LAQVLEAIIITGKRTPIGSFQGSLANISAPKLGSIAIDSVLNESKIPTDRIDEVIMGNVLPAGLGQAPARQAALGAGLPKSVECLTINKMCGSGLKAVMLAAQAIQTGNAEVVIAGGMENMSQAPYLLSKARKGYRMGHGEILDSMIQDGLWDVYNDQHMGNCAELCARERNYSREAQDAVAVESYTRAQLAQKKGLFKNEIVPVSVPQKKGEPIRVSEDDEPGKANFKKIPSLRPAFEKNGTITAANASKINDGAAALMITNSHILKDQNFKNPFQIISQASTAQEPEWFTTAPIQAIKKVLKIAGLNAGDINLWEINEAFAPVVMAAVDEFQLDWNCVNIKGGAIALGHPIGASGARILVTLIHSMTENNAKLGLATLCIGGGEASAIIVEKIG